MFKQLPPPRLTDEFQCRAVAVDVEHDPEGHPRVDAVQEHALEDAVDTVVQFALFIHVEMKNGALDAVAFRQRLCPMAFLVREIRTSESQTQVGSSRSSNRHNSIITPTPRHTHHVRGNL